ncbi:MAG TPA: efflux RND transporter periplasmic adaptor subunit [Leptolyngbyaceae cyanobacterium M33_DOE_097]|uniref:HlyD family efflux transporter periplasmic adaptor subunit n=1 Tax=Oscillatoriales cyanobacterium SpSt-418 TaxID=2282169 RepID=A0A7C3KC75_9CYAN|nr:efflux RND transporter periplasmic adaptor subunit [Leptolyngbyaceae cyanobacterium M33_DOE_097]
MQKTASKGWQAATPWLVWSGGLAAFSLIGALIYLFLLNRPTAAVPVTLVQPEQGDIENTINQSGTVELRGQVTLKSPTEGAVERVLVSPGDRTRQGQTLLTLRYPERQTALANQELQIQRQIVTLERERVRIQEAKESLGVEIQKREDMLSLVREGAIEKQRFLDQESRIRDARATLRDAEAAVNAGVIELERLKLEKQRIQQQIQNSIVNSPIDGVVLDVKVRDGDGVELRTDLLTLGDPRQEFIEMQLSTLDAARIKVNQLARVSIIGPNAKIYNGRVQALYPQALQPEASDSNNRQSKQAYVPAVVKLNRPSGTLIPGAQVNVEIVLEQRRNVLVLNSEAVQRAEGQPFVWVRDRDNKAQKQEVDLGIEGLLTVEITSGLDLTQEVIIPPVEPPLKPGLPITVKNK